MRKRWWEQTHYVLTLHCNFFRLFFFKINGIISSKQRRGYPPGSQVHREQLQNLHIYIFFYKSRKEKSKRARAPSGYFSMQTLNVDDNKLNWQMKGFCLAVGHRKAQSPSISNGQASSKRKLNQAGS
jgi:hypothetical protein